MGFDTAGGGGAPTDAEYVVLSSDADLSDERTLNAGAQLTATDSGAGSDVTLDSGAAPSDANYVVGASDPDLSSETTVSPASDILVKGDYGTTTTLSPGLDSWTTVDADNPALLHVELSAQTDGSTKANIQLEVDESGGTSRDYFIFVARAPAGLNSNDSIFSGGTVPLPAGAQFQVANSNDPAGGNALRHARAQILDP